jgi:hypothetical protein
LVKKMMFEKNKDYPFWRFEYFEHEKTFLICVKLWNVNFVINEKYSPRKWQSKLLCFTCDLSNIQEYNFKECPLTLNGYFDYVFTKKHLQMIQLDIHICAFRTCLWFL